MSASPEHLDVWVVWRYLTDQAPPELMVRVKEIVPTKEEADAEAERLNKLGKSHYFVSPGKYFPKGRDVQVGY